MLKAIIAFILGANAGVMLMACIVAGRDKDA